MKVGMLWFDNSETPITEKIKKAITYYINKYKVIPNTCYIHPTAYAVVVDEGISNITIKTRRQTHNNHFWIGIENEVR